jgi:hypothetical protein
MKRGAKRMQNVNKVIEALQPNATTHRHQNTSWRSYVLFLKFLDDAIKRIPTVEDATTTSEEDIEHILSEAMERLHSLLFGGIFPDGGIGEFFSYYEALYSEYQLDENRMVIEVRSRLVDELRPKELGDSLREAGCEIHDLTNLGILVTFPQGTQVEVIKSYTIPQCQDKNQPILRVNSAVEQMGKLMIDNTPVRVSDNPKTDVSDLDCRTENTRSALSLHRLSSGNP